MNNLIKFEKFKTINEAGNAIGHDDPFINVKGNFAGADQTLVGSAVLKIFNFFKRKGQQAMLFTYYKPKLHAEYMAGLLRYCVRIKMDIPKKTIDANTTYDALKVKDVNNNVVESQKIKIKLSNLLNNEPQVGTTVTGDSVDDGFYMIYDFERIYKVIGGKIADEGDIPDESTPSALNSQPANASDTTTTTNTTATTNDGGDDMVKSFCDKAISDIKSNPDMANDAKLIKELNDLIKMMKSNLVEINQMLADKKTIGNLQKRLEIENDRNTFTENLKELEVLKNLIIGTKQKPNQTTNNTNPTNQPTPAPAHATVADSYQYLNEGLIDKAVSKVTGKTMYTNPSPRHGDELNASGFGMADVNLYDEKFVSHFNIAQNKQAATNVAMESKGSIVQIQLAAERMYMTNDGKVDRKLQNNWFQMVETVKNKFGRFMFMEQLDPKTLRDKIGVDQESELKKKNGEITGMTGMVDQMKMRQKYDKASKIGQLIDNLRVMKSGDLGIMELSTGEDKSGYIFSYDTMTISGKSYPTYRLIGSIDIMAFLDKCEKNETDFTTMLNREKLFGKFQPTSKAYNINNNNYNYLTTFVVSSAVNTNVAINKASNVFIVYVYSNVPINSLKEISSSNCLLYACTTDGKITTFNSSNQTEKDMERKKIKVLTGLNIFHIKTSEKGKLGLTEKDQTLNLSHIEINLLKSK